MRTLLSTREFEKQAANRQRVWQWTAAPRILGAHAAAVVAKLGAIAPYAAIELVLPGGSLVALLLWLRRRRKSDAGALQSLDL